MTVQVVVEELHSVYELLKLAPNMIKCLTVEPSRLWFYFNEVAGIGTLYVTGAFSTIYYGSFVGRKTGKAVSMNQAGVPIVLVKRYALVFDAVKKHLESQHDD